MKTLTAMKKYVIGVGRQFGSGGHDIGKKLAERLGIKFYDKELLLEAAKEIGANPDLFKKNDEKLPSFYINNLSMNLGFYMQPFAASPASSYYDSVQKTVCDTIRTIAERESCVIMGRCADFLLRHNPYCINIFISASQDACAERITKRIDGLTIDDAKALAKKTNKLRAEYYNFYTDKEWGHSSSYDLCIDSSRLPEEDVINQIISYVNTRLAL